MNVTTRAVTPALAPEESIEGVTTWTPPRDGSTGGDAELLVYTSGGRFVSLALGDAGESMGERVLGQLPGELDGSKGVVLLARGQFVVVAEEFGLQGYVGRWVDESGSFDDWKPIERADYHSRHCSFPLALIEVGGEECLLHSTEWNRLDVTELRSGRHVMERRTSGVTTEGSEDDAAELDYFHGRLVVSPDGLSFVSGGWVWTPYDMLMTWTVAEYLASPESEGRSFEEPMTSGYNWDRPLAFVDDTTVAWGFNEREHVMAELPEDHPSELILHSTATGEPLGRIPFDHFSTEGSPCGEVSGGLAFDTARQQFVAYGAQHDTVVTDRAGEVLMTSTERWFGYSVAERLGWRVEGGKRLVLGCFEGD